jgi:iron complex outermembrane recepter protein
MQKMFRHTLYGAAFFLLYFKTQAQQRDTTGSVKNDSAQSVFGKKQLKEVVVVAQKNRYIEYQLDKIVVNASALIATAGGNAIDILNIAPGVMVDENGNISLKGREGVIVYIDDKPTHLAGTDLINYLRSLPVSMIDRVELMSNPSSRYGADGGAIINIRTKKTKLRGFNGSTSIGAGFARYFKSNNSLQLNYRNNHFNIYFNGGITINNGFFKSHRQRVYSYPDNILSYTLLQDVDEVNHQHGGNYKVGIDYNVSKNTMVGVLFNGSVQPYKETGKYGSRFIGHTGKEDSSLLSNSHYDHKPIRNTVNMNVQHFFSGSRREMNINLDYLGYENRSNQRLGSNLYWPDDSLVKQYALITEYPYAAKIYSAKANYSDTLWGSIKWEQGIQTIYSIRNNTSSYLNGSANGLYPDLVLNNSFRYRENIHAAYITLQKQFKRWSVQTGLRIESTAGNALQYNMALKPDTSFRIHYTNLFPTVYLLYKLDSNGKNTITFSAGKRIERPGYNDLNPSSFYFDRNTTNTGNSLLQPAFSTNMDLSYTYNGKFTAGINYSKTKGLITRGYKQVGDAFISTVVNVDHYRTLGISVSWSLSVTRWWILNINQEIENRHYRGAVFNEGLYANESLTSILLKTYHQFKIKNGWSADLSTMYRSKRLLWQSSFRPIGQVDAGIQKKINEKATVTVAATDIFYTWKIRRDVNIQYAQVYYLLGYDSQKINVTFSYRFGKGSNTRERKTGIEAEAGRVN